MKINPAHTLNFLEFVTQPVNLGRLKKVAGARIYDAFIFFNELDLFEIRLNVLAPYVDFFVLVESTKTHSGLAKPLFFLDHRARYKPFWDKMIHVIVNDAPDIDAGKGDRWFLEKFHRGQIARGLGAYTDRDIVMISDADEIPNPGKFKTMVMLLSFCGRELLRWEQKFHYYALNGFVRDGWCAPGACTFKAFRTRFSLSAESFRRAKGACTRIPDGGWHFSFLGGAEEIVRKIESFSHAEYDQRFYKNSDRLNQKIKEGSDLFERDGFKIRYRPIDQTYPDFLIKHQDQYSHLIRNPRNGMANDAFTVIERG